MKNHALVLTAAALSAALLAFAGWEIGSVTVKTRDTPAPAGYQTVSVEAVSGTTNGTVTVSYVTLRPVTNVLARLSLSGGYGYTNATAVTFKQGDFLFATGAPLTNGSAHVSIRR